MSTRDPATGRAPADSGPAGTTPAAKGGPRRRVLLLAAVAVFVLAADILTKALVVAHLRPGEPVHVLGTVLEWNLLRNPGAAFSVGTGDTILFTAIAVAVVVYIVRTARKLRSAAWALTLGLLLGGACGNLVDRIFRAPGLFRGDVVDFIEVTRYWPVFNLADSAIVCGGILTVLLALLGIHMDGTRGHEREPTEREPKGAAARGLRSEARGTSAERRGNASRSERPESSAGNEASAANEASAGTERPEAGAGER
jgi:signal peptidase II